MAHNAYIRPGNVWSGSAAFLTVELTALAEQVYQSINGDLGGTWAPVDRIIIGGAGFTVTGPANFDDLETFTAVGLCEFTTSGGLTFYDSTTCAFVESSQLAFINTTALTVGGTCTMTVSTSTAVAWSAPVNFSAGTHTYSGNTIAGAHTRTGATTYSGTGGRRIGRTVSNADVTVTYGNEVDTVFYAQTNNTNRGLELRVSASGGYPAAATGERIRVLYRRTPLATGNLAVTSEGTGGILTFGTNGSDPIAANNRGGAEFEFDGTQWRVASYWGTGTSVSALLP